MAPKTKMHTEEETNVVGSSLILSGIICKDLCMLKDTNVLFPLLFSCDLNVSRFNCDFSLFY